MHLISLYKIKHSILPVVWTHLYLTGSALCFGQLPKLKLYLQFTTHVGITEMLWNSQKSRDLQARTIITMSNVLFVNNGKMGEKCMVLKFCGKHFSKIQRHCEIDLMSGFLNPWLSFLAA